MKKIKIMGSWAKWENDKHFVLAKEDLHIEVEGQMARYSLFGHVVNEGKDYRIMFDKNKGKIPFNELKNGLLELTLEYVKNGEVYKTIAVEGLVVKALKEGKEIIPEFTALEERVKRLEKSIAQIYKYIKEKGAIV